jgi:hypothetical protein
MRTTTDLIRELEQVAARFNHTALVVGFENHTEFVFGHQDDKLSKLNECVGRGGEPIGMIAIAIDPVEHLATVFSRPLQVHAKDAWVEPYLQALIASFSSHFDLAVAKQQRWPN